MICSFFLDRDIYKELNGGIPGRRLCWNVVVFFQRENWSNILIWNEEVSEQSRFLGIPKAHLVIDHRSTLTTLVNKMYAKHLTLNDLAPPEQSLGGGS